MISVNDTVHGPGSNRTRITIATNATGGGTMRVTIGGVLSAIAPGGADTAIVSAAAMLVQLDANLSADYTNTDNLDGTVDVVYTGDAPADGQPVYMTVHVITTDATQTITATSQEADWRLLSGVTAAGAGAALVTSDGFSILDYGKRHEQAQQGVTLLIRARLNNGSAGAKTCVWRLMCYSPVLGWFPHVGLGERTITAAAGTDYITDDILEVELFGVTRVQPQLMGVTAAGVALTTRTTLDAWAAYGQWRTHNS
jgi:hypothetical protein